MRKIFVFIFLLTIIFVANDLNKEEVIIPKESIRFRVIANSDSKEDQDLKIKVKDNLNKDILSLLNNKNSLEEVRKSIKEGMPLLENTINKTLKENNSNIDYNINYGENYFPVKEYKNVVYQDGNYESLVVKLGKGEGQNFWCVLFPPLCLIDEDEKEQDIEYHLLVKDILNKYININ